jgi:Zn-dependent alcohol dehydrogenase
VPRKTRAAIQVEYGKTISQLLPSVKGGIMDYDTGGEAVLVGVPQAPDTVPVRDFFGSAKKIMGCSGGTGHRERDFPTYVRWFKEGKMPLDLLVTRRYGLEEINEACEALAAGKILGRAIIEF